MLIRQADGFARPDVASSRGPVNLPNGGHAKTGRFSLGAFRLALRGDARLGDLALHDDRPGTKRPIARLRDSVAGTVTDSDIIMEWTNSIEGRSSASRSA